MSLLPVVRLGSYCDVVPHPQGGVAFAWTSDLAVTVERIGNPDKVQGLILPLWSRPLPSALLFLRCAVSPWGEVMVVGKAHTGGNGVAVFAGGSLDLGPTNGQDVIGIRWSDVDQAFEVWLVQDVATYCRVRLSTMGVLLNRQAYALADVGRYSTSQGFRDVLPDGTLVWGDPVGDGYYTIPDGRLLYRINQREYAIAGQGVHGLALYFTTDGRLVSAIFGVWPTAQPPHVAVQGTLVAVCAFTGVTAQLTILTPPYPPHEGVGATTPPPIDPTKPPPVEPPVVPPVVPPVEPPVEPPVHLPVSLYHTPKEYHMAVEEVGAIKVGPLFARVVAGGAGQGPFGWYQILFDRETPDDDCWWTLSKPDTRHAVIHTKVPCLLGGDQKEAEDFIFYGKPVDLGRGILESPVFIKDPASALIVGYFTWPDRHPTGGTAAPSFAWVKRA